MGRHDSRDVVGARAGQRVEDVDAIGWALRADAPDGVLRQLLADLLALVEARAHFVVGLVDAAAADGIVRLVLQQQSPRAIDQAGF